MNEKTFSYKDDYPCVYEGMKFFYTYYYVKNKKNCIACFFATVLISFLINIYEILNSSDSFFSAYLLFFTLICGALSVLYYHIYCLVQLKVDSSRIFITQKEQNKEIVLRNEDILFKRDFCSSNYYYDEFVAVIEGKKSVSFFVEKNAQPVIFSKSEQNTEVMTAILKEKLGKRYIDKTKGGRKK